MITISPRSTGNGRGIFKDTRRIFFATAGLLAALSAQTAAAPVQLVKTFDKVPDGAYPSGRLLVGLDGAIYGANTQGGTNDHGTLFKVNPNGTGFTVLKQLDSPVTGKNPFGGMVQGPDGTIYGTTAGGGTQGGTVFKIQPDGTGFTVLQQLIYNPHGNGTRASLLLNGTVLYGATYTGGTAGDFGGAVFKLNTNGTGFTVLKSFSYGVHGGNIQTGLSQGSDGVLYGAAPNGGPNSGGTVFKLNPDGTGFTVLRSFVNADGINPSGPVVGNDGALYGVTEYGGTENLGTLYKMNTDGTSFTVLRNFTWGTGGNSRGGLTKRSDGKFFGVTTSGAPSGQAVVYSVGADGSGYTVESILTPAIHGQHPQDTVALGADGTIYGAGYTAGALNFGAVFSQAPAPTGKVLSFDGTNDYVRSTNPAGLPTGNSDHTVEFWVNYTGGQTGHRYFLWHGTPSSGERSEIYGYDSATGRLRLHRYSPNDKLTNVTLPLNTWTHLAYVYRGASRTTEIFMNGTLAQTLNFTADLNLTSANLQLGTYDSSSTFSANARMDEVRIWNHARSGAQILSKMNSELLGTESGLGVYYNFNQGNAGNNNAGITTLTDTSASANNGTLLNFALTGATSNWIAPGVPFPNPEIAVEQPASSDIADGGSRAFGTVAVGGNSSLTFTIANSGAGTLVGLGITIDGANSADFSVTSSPTAPVVGGGTTTFTVRFAPASPGAKTAALHIANNDSDEAPFDITLTGTSNFSPVLSVPGAPVIAEATGATGAAVAFSVSATDTEDGTAPAIATPASGSTFPFGDTTVNVSATDSHGATTNGSFIVRVRDTTAPTLSVPANIIAEATSAAGAVVTFSPTATDAVDPAPSVSATPVSGSTFAIGTTPVSVSATDVSSNSASGGFSVTVQDTTAPSATAPAGRTIYNSTAPNLTSLVIASDAVGVASITQSPTAGATLADGVHVFTFTVLDITGLSTVVTTNVTVDTTNSAPSAVDDAVATTTGTATVYPLANDLDADGDALTLVSVNEPSVVIDGRALIIPAGYTGTFAYTATDGRNPTTADVTVTAATPQTARSQWTGLLRDSSSAIVGRMDATRSTLGSFTSVARIGSTSTIVKFTLVPEPNGTVTVATALGACTATEDAATGRLEISIAGTSGPITSSMRRSALIATPQKVNVALASIDAGIPGGGIAKLTMLANGNVEFSMTMPDGKVVSGKTEVADNGTMVLFSPVMQTTPGAYIAGELNLANLTKTDITGELAWLKPAQTAAGMHQSGVNTVLVANGCIYTPGVSILPNGAGTLRISGGNLAATSTTAALITAGKPKTTPIMGKWVAEPTKGTFTPTVRTPARPTGTSGTGIYLPKSNSAWGYFPGVTLGGRIELTQP